ncbi:MAG: hypothetical protein U0790_06465 [Isosphaeraceae bacterium]
MQNTSSEATDAGGRARMVISKTFYCQLGNSNGSRSPSSSAGGDFDHEQQLAGRPSPCLPRDRNYFNYPGNAQDDYPPPWARPVMDSDLGEFAATTGFSRDLKGIPPKGADTLELAECCDSERNWMFSSGNYLESCVVTNTGSITQANYIQVSGRTVSLEAPSGQRPLVAPWIVASGESVILKSGILSAEPDYLEILGNLLIGDGRTGGFRRRHRSAADARCRAIRGHDRIRRPDGENRKRDHDINFRR